MQLATPSEILTLAHKIMTKHFPAHGTSFLDAIFDKVEELFTGHYPGYQACDLYFHDLSHTCIATEAVIRLLDGHIKGDKLPALRARDLDLAIAASLLHDSGYIKEIEDKIGTGAKYTLVHPTRSAEFAAKFLPQFGLSPNEIRVVQIAIYGTGVNVDMSKLQIRDDREKYLACVIGTGDILGQMAAFDYPDRLPALFAEYKEAISSAETDISILNVFESPDDLMSKTRWFYEGYVRRMLETQWGSVYRDLEYHFQGGINKYISAIEANVKRIEPAL